MSRPVHPRSRRLHALLLCVLWLAGFEVGPGLHVALHEVLEHHHHGVPALAQHEGPHEHEHGHEHEHAVEFEDVSREHDLLLAEAEARCANDLQHGAHALAHRGVAAVPTPPAWPPVAVASCTSLDRGSDAFEPIRSRVPRCVRARGPPA